MIPAAFALLIAQVSTAPLTAACKTSNATVQRPAELHGVHERLSNALAHDSFPSMTIAVSKAGSLIWSAGYGCSDVASQIPAVPTTRYVIASVTKPIAATGIAILADRGLLDLNDRANDHLPKDTQIRNGAGDANAVTIRQILQHRAGLPSFTIFSYENRPELKGTIDQYIERYAFLANPAGERYAYSNIGYGVLQRIIEHGSKQSFGDFLAHSLFGPLGMTRTTVGREGGDIARNYDGRLHLVPRFDLVTDGAGFVFSTAEDLIRFGNFHLKLLRPATRVLSDDWIDRMVNDNQSTGTTGGYFGTDWFYGLGWGGRDRTQLDHRWYGHEGGMPGTSSVLRMWPDHQLAVAIISNSRNVLPEQIANSIADALIVGYPELRARDAARTRPIPKKSPISNTIVGEWRGVIETHTGAQPIAVRLEADGTGSVVVNGERSMLTDIEHSGERWKAYSDGALRLPEFKDHKQRLYHEFTLRDGALKGFVMTYQPNETVFYAPFYGTLQRAATLFGRGVFSTGAYELSPTFTSDGRTAYFTVSTPAYGRLHMIMESTYRNGVWTPPVIAPFSGRFGDADPMLSPDGSELYFISKRPLPGSSQPKRDFDIWKMRRAPTGWGEPAHVAAASGPDAEHYVSLASSGSLYIAAVRPDSRGRGDLYVVKRSSAGTYTAPENLGATVNSSDHHDTTPYVASDESYIIFSSWGRPDGRGPGGDLYVTFKQSDGTWTRAVNLGPAVNSSATEYCPVVSPDGHYLYFTSERGFADKHLSARIDTRAWNERINAPGNGLGDTYRVELAPLLARAREQLSSIR